MTVLHQVVRRTGRVKRVPPGEVPVIEVHLEEHQYVSNFVLTEDFDFSAQRKTSDWTWVAYIVSPLP